jgi:hypothetical protein
MATAHLRTRLQHSERGWTVVPVSPAVVAVALARTVVTWGTPGIARPKIAPTWPVSDTHTCRPSTLTSMGPSIEAPDRSWAAIGASAARRATVGSTATRPDR